MTRSALRLSLLAALAFLAALPALAATYTSSTNGNWSASATWGGAGVPGGGDTAVISGGTTVTLDVPVSVANVTMTGNLNGSQNLTVTTLFNWNGGTQSGSGTTSIPSGSVMTLGGYGTLDGRPLNIGGTLNLTSTYYFYMQNNAVLTNSGTIDYQGDAGIYQNGVLGTTSVSSSGTIKKSAGTGTSYLTVPLTTTSGSQFQVQSGTFYPYAVTSSGTAWSVASGAKLYFTTSDVHTFDAASSITGAGDVQWSAGTNTVSGTYNITGSTTANGGTTTLSSITSLGALTLNGGILTLNSASALSLSTLSLAGGTLNGTAPINFTGTSMTWGSFTIAGSGAFSIPVSATVTVAGYPTFDGRPVTNAGTINYTSTYYSYLANNATLANSGTIDYQGDGGMYVSGGVGSIALTNSGTIKKSAGSGTATINVPLVAQSGSQLLVQSGIVSLGAVTSTGATFSVPVSTTLAFSSSDTRTFDAASSISGAGQVSFSSGTNTVGASYNITGITGAGGGTTTLSNIVSVGSLSVSGGTLTLNSASALSVPALTIAGGTLNGTAPINLTSTSMTWSGGIIGGTGALSIPGSTTITVAGYPYFDTRAVTNAGTINITSSYYIYFQNNATLNNSGTIDIQGDGGFYVSGTVGSIAATNSGTIKKSGGAGAGGTNVPLTATSGSQLLAQSGSFYLGAVTSTGATFSVASGKTLAFYYSNTRTFDAASSISGAGTVDWVGGTNSVSGTYNITGVTKASGATTTLSSIASIGDLVIIAGTLTLNSASALSAPTLTMQGGTLNGSAPINITGTSQTWSGGTIATTGTLALPASMTLTLASIVLDGVPVTSAGIINIPGTGQAYLQNNATLTNNGTFDLQADGNVYLNSTPGTTAVINNGTIKKSGGTGSGSVFNVALTAQSGSQFLVQSGTIYAGAVASTGATFTVASGDTLSFYYGYTRTFDAASTISGAGTVVWNGGTNTVSGTYNITGTTLSTAATTTIGTSITSIGNVTMQGGTLTLNSASALSIPLLTMQGGTLNGSAPLNVTGTSQTWSGGVLGGSGTLSIPAPTTLSLTGSVYLDARPFTFAGTVNVSGSSSFYMQNNATLANSGTIDFQSDYGGITLNSVLGTTAITNSGTIRKSGGANYTTINIPLTMQSGSQLLAQSGTFYLGAINSTSATFQAASGATLWFNTVDTRTFDSATVIFGAGTAQWAAGTNTVSGAYNITGATASSGGTTTITNITSVGALVISGGTLTLDSASPLTVPTLAISGGIFAGTAPLNLTGSAMTWSSGTITGSGAISIPASTILTINFVVIDGRPVTNAGTINVPSTNYFYLQNNAVLTNSGTIDIQGDGHIYLNGAAGTTSLVNSGTIRKSGGSGASTVSVPLTAQSGSQFLVQSGTVYVSNAVTSTSATFNVASGKLLSFNTGDTRTFDAGSTISGAGTVQWAAGTNNVLGTYNITGGTTGIGGTTTISGVTACGPLLMQGGTLALNGAAISAPSLTMQGGVLSGSAPITLAATSMTWTGGTVAGSGLLTIPAGATLSLSAVYFDTRPVTSGAAIGIPSSGYVYMLNNAVFTNNGTIDIPADGNIYLSGTAGTTAIVNNGTIKKSGGTTSQITVAITAQSGSQFLVQAGTMYVDAVTSTGGTFSASSGAILAFYYGSNRSFDAATTFSGAGTMQFNGGANTFAGTITASLSMGGGTFTLTSASAQSFPALTMSGGTLNGTTNVNLTGPAMTWSGGIIAGSGSLSISAASNVSVAGYPYLDGRAVTNAGLLKITSFYQLYMQNNAALTNNGTIDFQGDSSIYLTAGSATLTNNGALTKSSGTGNSYVTVTPTNAAGGTIQPANGTINFTTLTNAGTLLFPITSATGFGKINVANAFTLGGTLTATTVAYTPPNGTSFPILTFASSSGAFAAKNLNYSGGTFTENYTATSLTLSAGPVALALNTVTPSSGPASGGTSVSLSGASFTASTTVTFGGVPAASVTYNNATSITATTPAHAAGPVDVVVTNPGPQTATLTNGFKYVGLVANYTFDVAGNPGKDGAGSNDAASVNGVTQVAGRTGQAGSFSAGYMDLPNNASLQLRSGDFTLEAFVNSTSLSNGNWFTKATSGPSQQYGIGTSGGTKALFSFDGGSGGSVTSTSNIFDGTWHHVAAIKRGNSAEIWVDGRLEASSAITGSADSAPFAIGRAGSCCESFTGLIDEARIYNYALSQAEVRTDALVTDLGITKSATPTVSVGQNITYALNVTNYGPLGASGVVVTDVLPPGASFVSATPQQGSCSGSPTITCNVGLLGNGATTSIAIVATATTSGTLTNNASVTASEGDPSTANNAASASTTVSAATCTPPTITAGGATTFCSGGSVLLTANAVSPISYQWFNNNIAIGGANASTYSATASGSYSVQVTYANSCSATSAATIVTAKPLPTVTAAAAGPAVVCGSSSVTLNATASGGSGSFVSYQWYSGASAIGGATSASYVTTSAGSYSVTVTDSGGCTSSPSAPVVVSVSPAPNVSISGPSSVCANTNFTLDAGAGFATYSWSTGATTQTISVSQSAASVNYSVTVTNGAGCSANASKSVTTTPSPSAAITAPPTVQPNSSSNAASVVAGPAGTTYAWTLSGSGAIVGSNSTPSITFSAGGSGTLTLNVVVTNGSCSNSGSVTIPIGAQVADLALAVTSSPQQATVGDTITWTLAPSNAGQNNATSVTVSAALPSNVTLVSSTGSGWSCSGTSTINCTANGMPVGNASTISIVATANAAGAATLQASIAASTVDPTAANNSASATTQVAPVAAPCATSAPSLVAPADGATNLASPVTFQWSAVPNATSYELWLSSGVASPSLAGTTSSTSLAASLSPGAATWFVIARSGPNCAPMVSATRSFSVAASTNCNHNAPQLTSPAANAVTSSPVTFAWQSVPGASGYRVSVAIDGDPAQDVGTTTTATTLSVTLTPGSIVWFVDALFDDGCPFMRSATSPFTITRPDPCANRSAATLVAPQNNTTLGGSSVDFHWTAVAGASGYRVWAAINNAPPQSLGSTTADTTLHATISSGHVEWFVETLFDGCASVESAHATFTVPASSNCPTTGAAPLLPANGATTSTAQTAFTWNAAANAISYEVWLSLNDGTPTLLGSTSSTSLTHEVAPGALQWFVRSYFNGCRPVDSPSSAFTYVPPPACGTQRPLLTAPADATPLVSPVDFDWSAVAGAAQYKVWLSLDHAPFTSVGTTSATQLDHISVGTGNAEWYVEALMGNNCPSTLATHGNFTVVPAPPQCATPSIPVPRADSEVSSGLDYVIRWTPQPNADHYEVQESLSADFLAAVVLPATSTQLAFRHANTSPLKATYYYRVRTVGRCNGDRSLYSGPVIVGVLPQQVQSQTADGSTPADNPQSVTYQLPIDAPAGTPFTATTTVPWLTVAPSSGVVAQGGTTLVVTADTHFLGVGTNTGAVNLQLGATSSSSRGRATTATSSTTTVNVNLVQPIVPGAKNTPPPDALIIPAVAHADGINSKFQSDVRVTNTSPQVMKYQLTFTPSGENGAQNVQQTQVNIEPGKTLALDDILRSWFASSTPGSAGTGTLEIRPLTQTTTSTSSQSSTGVPNIVTFAASRTFNTTSNGTFGQYIPAIPFSSFIGKAASGASSILSLQQVAQSAAYRTNLGLVEGSGNPATVLLRVFGDDGHKLTEFTQNLAGGQHLQLNSILAQQGLTVNDGRIDVQVVSPNGKVTAYASVLDNLTNDPLLVTPVQVNDVGASTSVLLGIADLHNGFANWQSDVRIYNPTSQSVPVSLNFYAQGSTTPATATLSIAPNEVKQLDGALAALFHLSNVGGALHVGSGLATLVATARTYNQTTSGTYGQFISGVTQSEGVGAGQRPLQLLQVEESTRFRTNLGIAELSGNPAHVVVSVLPPDSKVTANLELDLQPFEFRQYGSILNSLGLGNTYNARIAVKVTSGQGRVTAYASVIDALTQDPTYVPAQ